MFTLDQARARMRRAMLVTDTSEAGAGPATATESIAALDALDGGAETSAEPAEPAATEVQATDDGDDDPEGADALGDAGKRALAEMKAKWRAERDKRQTAEAKLRDALPQDDAQRLAAEAEAKALAKANTRILSAEIRAAATGKLSDPADALTFLDLTRFEVDDDGSVDQAEIDDAITDLLARKPYLAAQGGTPKAPKVDPSQGAVGGAPTTAAERFSAQMNGLI
jgi:hypothetical protein